jgi:transposase
VHLGTDLEQDQALAVGSLFVEDRSQLQRGVFHTLLAGSEYHQKQQERLDPSRLDDLKSIGVDEFGYRKSHQYLTVVVDHDRRKVIWAATGRGSGTRKAFFGELGPDHLSKLETATIDIAAGYIKAFEEEASHVYLVLDSFHVTNGLVEGIKNRMRMVAPRSFGFHSAGPLIGMLFFCCGDVPVYPPLSGLPFPPTHP